MKSLSKIGSIQLGLLSALIAESACNSTRSRYARATSSWIVLATARACEFAARTPYHYSSYDEETEVAGHAVDADHRSEHVVRRQVGDHRRGRRREVSEGHSEEGARHQQVRETR